MDITIERFTSLPTNPNKNLKAVCDVRIFFPDNYSISIREIFVFQQPALPPFIKLPYRSHADDSGKVRFRATVGLPTRIMIPLAQKILTRYQEEKEKPNEIFPKVFLRKKREEAISNE